MPGFTKEAALEIVDSHIRTGAACTAVIQQKQARNPGPVDPDFVTRSVNNVMSTLRIKVLSYKKTGGALSPLVNVYLYTTANTAAE